MSQETRTALITGSAGGLGKAIADEFLTRGFNVVVCDINRARLSEAENQYGQSFSDRILFSEVNVTDEVSVEKLVAATVEKFGRLDVLVNNAGVMDHFDPAGTCDKTMWDKVIAVNLTGPFLLTKHAVRIMEKQASGIIINIGSTASIRGISAGVAYTASKHGVVALTKNTAGFYGSKGISSVALLLGGMNTNISEAFTDGINMEGMKLMEQTQPGFIPGKTNIPTQYVARYAIFLSESGISTSANGSCITFNNNWPVA
jgi:NAD(P)-dependent dehydrogenase (short-subunit alcohol dehydrogenase family)